MPPGMHVREECGVQNVVELLENIGIIVSLKVK